MVKLITHKICERFRRYIKYRQSELYCYSDNIMDSHPKPSILSKFLTAYTPVKVETISCHGVNRPFLRAVRKLSDCQEVLLLTEVIVSSSEP